jgi:glycerol-3-phosphate acyltransferase PlsY
MTELIMVAAAFLAGSLPFAVWVGRLALGADVRRFGDGNPGTTNVLRAGGVRWGAVVLVLDFLKGALPVAFAHFVLGFDGLALLAIALAPPLGHAFSPFLRFRGGKALAASGGIWCGLTIWEVPTVGGLLLGFWYAFIEENAWAVVFMALSLLAYLVLTQHDPLILAVWLGNFLLILWKHRGELTQPPTLRRWFTQVTLPWRP